MRYLSVNRQTYSPLKINNSPRNNEIASNPWPSHKSGAVGADVVLVVHLTDGVNVVKANRRYRKIIHNNFVVFSVEVKFTLCVSTVS